MANEMPPSSNYDGLTRTVLEYGEGFLRIVEKAKAGGIADADWAAMEAIVDTDGYERLGVFLGDKAERFGWATYKSYIEKYAGYTNWEGTLRHVTEQDGRVILELEERNTRGGETDVSNTVTIYEFDERGRIRHLDVYVMHLP